jgi:hypothetical protein
MTPPSSAPALLSPDPASTPPATPEPRDFTVWQARLARWRRAAELCERAEHAAGRLRAEMALAARAELERLSDVESLFAFPGNERRTALALHLDQRLLTTAAVEARAIVRNLHLFGDSAARLDGRPGRYRTVLLLDGRARQRRTALEAALDLLRHRDDPYCYALVAAMSLEEALAAVRYNPYVGACILGSDVMRDRRAPEPLLPPEEQLRLRAVGPATALEWWTEWLRSRERTVQVVSLRQPLGQLHRLLAHG